MFSTCQKYVVYVKGFSVIRKGSGEVVRIGDVFRDQDYSFL